MKLHTSPVPSIPLLRVCGAAGALLLSVVSHGFAAPLVLDTGSPYFYDNFQSGTLTDKWNYNASGSGTTITYGAAGPVTPADKTFYMSMNTSGYVQPYTTTTSWPSSYPYGASIDVFVPTATSFLNSEIFGLTILSMPFPSPVWDRTITMGGAGTTTNTTFEITAWGSLDGASGGSQQTLTLDRGTWNTVQIDHLNTTSSGMPVYVNNTLWMYLNVGTTDYADGVWLGNNTGSAATASGEIYYDNVLVANAIPEPAAATLLGGSLVLLALRRRRH